ncbi:unnamed protein product [Onchocerca flexuosa]|uniref:ZP domain-containing protein n=1 Tax=Onchocerca flexuosa TaxID=387005 RepID=A0A183HXR6_9BILA|nr:unnamed protein product [Onchocerca flexuosa]
MIRNVARNCSEKHFIVRFPLYQIVYRKYHICL